LQEGAMSAVESREEKKYAYTVIIERIRDMIAGGELAPGDRLPPERKLADALGVSRNSLRQAFQALAERKIIESRQGDGTYLLASTEAFSQSDAIFDTINAQSGFIRDILEFRHLMEPQIAALAASRIEPAALDRLKILVCDQQRALMAGREDDTFDSEFHRQLAQCSGNRVISQMMTTIASVINATRSTWLQSNERRNASVEGHLRIIDALESGDADSAFNTMKAHIAEIENHILGEPKK
jgi:GntR family transcriptional repressor for pyruvate dehydrogenase complex